MPFVIVAAPFFTDLATRFIETTLSLPDVRLGLVSQDPLEALRPDLQPRLAGHWRIDSVLDSGQLAHAAHELSRRHGPIHRLFSGQEQVQVSVAQAREWLGIPGMRVPAALNFRDKGRMKYILHSQGLPIAYHKVALADDEAWQFAAECGFPLVVKPLLGAGSAATFRVAGPDDLTRALGAAPPAETNPVLLEEFILGVEHSFDAYTLGSEILWHSVSRYTPTPLEVMENPWIQWQVVVPREVDDPLYDDIRAAAGRALKALDMPTGMCHMEWFRRRDGSIAISEVAVRPPGAQFTTLISRANDFDAIRAWVNLLIYETFDPPERKYAAGAAYLRGQGYGRVVETHGLHQVYEELGHLVTDAKMPARGQATSGSYEGEGYIIVRHPQTSIVEEALRYIVSVVRVELGE